MFMRQCKLQACDPFNHYYLFNEWATYQYAWIPEKFAQEGKILLFKNDGFKQNWRVEKVYPKRRSIEESNKRSQDYKKQRKASDI